MSQAKAIAALLLVVAIASVAWFIKGQAEEIGALTTTVGAQQETIRGYEKSTKLDKDSDAVTDKVTAKAAEDKTAVQAATQATQDKSKAQEAAIRHKYEKLIADAKAQSTTTPEPENIAALEYQEAQEISSNRLDSVWEEYCRDNNAPSCPLPATT